MNRKGLESCALRCPLSLESELKSRCAAEGKRKVVLRRKNFHLKENAKKENAIERRQQMLNLTYNISSQISSSMISETFIQSEALESWVDHSEIMIAD